MDMMMKFGSGGRMPEPMPTDAIMSGSVAKSGFWHIILARMGHVAGIVDLHVVDLHVVDLHVVLDSDCLEEHMQR